MRVPAILFVVSIAGVGVALSLPDLSDLLLLALPCAVAALWLLVQAWRGRDDGRKPEWILVDGSNVMHWKDNTPRLETVREAVDHLKALGFAPGVVFDANVGYLVAGRYQHDGALSKALGLPEDQVMVVAKGTQADPILLAAAGDLKARIVTNDRYRDWADAHPEVARPGFLVKGGYRDGSIWVDLQPARAT